MRNHILPAQHAQQFLGVAFFDDGEFVEVEFGEAFEGGVQVVFGSDGDDAGGHHVAGVGELPDRFVEQVAADVVGGEDADEPVFAVDDGEVVLTAFGDEVQDVFERDAFVDGGPLLEGDGFDFDAFQHVDHEVAAVGGGVEPRGELFVVQRPPLAKQEAERGDPHRGDEQAVVAG